MILYSPIVKWHSFIQSFLFCLCFFNSIADIIEHYRKEQIVEGYYLKDPVPMQVRHSVQEVYYFSSHGTYLCLLIL